VQRNKLITGPAVEPVSLDEAKAHARIEYPDDDALVTSLITASRLVCEHELRRAFVDQVWETYLDAWPGTWIYPGSWYYGSMLPQTPAYYMYPYYHIQIDNPDLVSVTSLTYIDQAGALQTLDPSTYQILPGAPGRIYPAFGHTWPLTRTQPDAITARYTCGYGPAATDVPEPIRTAIKLMVAELYENREMSATQAYECNPLYRALLAPGGWGDYP
jgi:hypothetical protein